ncbi:murein DD-endopeptidase MepM/ murein hydrolase activator NlpD [Paenarthrobacter histidinolovorans]|uniref:Murein DD-endopeptidase MepM/ murein hydrolase activator NlpD n=2 Tax=Paenarthrobacter histidinolovorans TaxID=43664 RepID=A0ABW8N3C6_9MICC
MKAGKGLAAGGALFAVPLMLVGSMVLMGGGEAQAGTCADPAAVVQGTTLPSQVAGFSGEQLTNAAVLMDQAKKAGMSVQAQILVVQAGIGESTLRSIDYTDAAGTVNGVAITIGILQQDESYGQRADRLDVAKAGSGFLSRLKAVPGWESLEPSLAIHRVQRNADPDHYTRFRSQAVQVVEALGGAKVSGGECSSPGGSTVGQLAGKWTNPLPGAEVTSPYGPRGMVGSIGGVLANFHYGMDFSTPGHAGTVVAPADLKITVATDTDTGTGSGTHVKGQTLDGKLTIGMYHMETGSLRVKVGDTVAAGTPIGTEGATGNVTGRHLHLEFFLGSFTDPWVPIQPTTDPAPILKEKGAL